MKNDILLQNEWGKLSFLRGGAKAYIAGINEYRDVPDTIQIQDALYLEGSFVASIKFSEYEIIYPSLDTNYDVFYFEENGEYHISYDFYDIVEQYKDRLSVNKCAEKHFIKKGYFEPEETFFNEIRRVRIGNAIIRKLDEKFCSIITLPIKKWNVNKEIYKNGLICSIKLNAPYNNEYLLFSGGRDSALLALILKKELNVDIKLITGIVENLEWDEEYENRVKYFSDKLDCDYKLIPVNYDHYSFDDLIYLVKKMPLCAHTSIIFDTLNRYIEKENGRVWTGQDSDSMYALGKTGGKMGPILARLILSDAGLKTLKDVEGASPISYLLNICSYVYSRKHKKKVRIPKNIEELRRVMLKSETGMPLISSKEECINSKCSKPKDIFGVRRLLFEDKLSSHLVGGDHRIITYAGNISKKPVYPFSSVLMILIQINIPRGIRESVINKRYISELIKDYIGRKDFRKIYPPEVFDFSRKEDAYYVSILKSTNFGKSLSHISLYQDTTYQKALSKTWEKYVMRSIGEVNGRKDFI